MTLNIRPATTDDLTRMIELLLMDAEERRAEDAILWDMADDAAVQIGKAVTFALTAERQPFRQFWQVAEDDGKILGVVHSMMLPVPPIYAGAAGEPGLILPDSFAAPDAPDGTVNALVEAAEARLREAGARVLVSSFVTGRAWEAAFQRQGYNPLTLYLSRVDLGDAGMPPNIHPATAADVPGIVARSAQNRQVLVDIDPFWAIHPDADARFSAWMTRSLTLPDRDVLVMGPAETIDGYVIAQPASRLHFSPGHDITGTGVIDDFYHLELANPTSLANEGAGSMALLRAAEAAFAERGMGAAFVVCPAGWQSKIMMLEAAGYEIAMVWSIKR